MPGRNQMRAARYRVLAAAETDASRSALLNRLADEAERGVLCTLTPKGRMRLAHSAQAAAPRSHFDIGSGRLGFL